MTYKKLRNEVTRQLQITEAAYWKEPFSKAKTSKEFWVVVNKLKRKQKDHRIGPLKDENDNLVTDDTEKAELMNSYFTQVGQELSEALDSSFDTSDVSYINRITPTCGRLEMNQKRFDGQFKDIKPVKAMGYDQIGWKEFKIAGESIKPGIRNIIMKSLSDKTCPNNWKPAIMKTLLSIL